LIEKKEDAFLHVKSEQKQLKENSIDEKHTQRFIEKISYQEDKKKSCNRYFVEKAKGKTKTLKASTLYAIREIF